MKKTNQLLKLFLFSLLSCLSLSAYSQYWQQQVNYVIDVKLNDRDKILDAFERITYFNNSPDTLRYIWFHLWPNAYKNDRTAFSDQTLENGNTKFYFSDKDQKGYINHLDFKVDGTTAKTEDHPQYIDIIKLILPRPLLPKQQATITTPFHVKLPFNFSRGGYDSSSYQVTQWYPKPAVYDAQGWHPIPYLDQGEFYSEFGDFDVRITVPKDYVVAATGLLQSAEELEWLKTRSKAVLTDRPSVKKSYPPKRAVARKPLGSTFQNPAPPSVAPVETKTLVYKQDHVHDFAWFANKDFLVNYDTCRLTNGKTIDVFTYYTPMQQPEWKNSLQFAKDAIHFYSDQVGEYPYDIVSAVQGPQSFGGGMEYPTITIISPASSEKELDETITHEIGHNWFYGILASNERDHPWMDEGINSFYEYKYMEMKYGKRAQGNELLFQTKAFRKTDQPIETPSTKFSEANYALTAYYKTASWMKDLEIKLGSERFREMMHRYFTEWSFKHPSPEDFKAIVQSVAGAETAAIFSLLSTKGMLPGHELKGFYIISPFKRNSLREYQQNPTKDILFISPAIGFNSYDKLMIGGLFTNYKLPPNRFEYLAIPLYATGSKKLTGSGKLTYTIPSYGKIRQTDIFINGSTFSMNDFTDTAGRRLLMHFQKLVPGIKISFKERDPRSAVHKYIQWKTFFISEQSLSITRDTAINGRDTALLLHYSTPTQKRYLNQLQFVYENYRALYPFDVTLQVEQAKDFVRPALTANYFFNYPSDGGLQLRFFAGKFIYLNGKTLRKQFDNDRYFLNMTGPKGDEDYTYSDYFVGRNRFEGVASQQIMIRDGGFKVRTDLLANKIGKTDNWLVALNLTSTLPKKLNPLSVLPIKIPLRVFMDIGTYAEAWDKNAEGDRVLYDLGLQIPLLSDIINIYIPVLYNKVYGDYFKSTLSDHRFLKTISFSINLYPKSLRKLNYELLF